jgi:3'-phosphoadenosine 5'-phosphosulfate sulfotransferase (PAPS reductase)/FAD synthetase
VFISQEATGEQTMSASSDDEWVSARAILEEIRQVYRHSKRDWIVAFSGGKDSTATLQLIWYALTRTPFCLDKPHGAAYSPSARKKRVCITGKQETIP